MKKLQEDEKALKKRREREEIFCACALWGEEQSAYRKFLDSPNWYESSGDIPPVIQRAIMNMMVAGLMDKSVEIPNERMPFEQFLLCRVRFQEGIGQYAPSYVSIGFVILRGGRTIWFDDFNWWRVVEFVLQRNEIRAWPLDDEKVLVRFCETNKWFEVHPRKQIPLVVERFRGYLTQYIRDVICAGTEGGEPLPEDFPFKFPIGVRLEFRIPHAGGLKICAVSDEVDGRSVDWFSIEVLPLTQVEKGILADPSERKICCFRDAPAFCYKAQ